jgi:hypothetical protein
MGATAGDNEHGSACSMTAELRLRPGSVWVTFTPELQMPTCFARHEAGLGGVFEWSGHSPNSGSDGCSEEALAVVIFCGAVEAPRDTHAPDGGDELFADSECWHSLQ